MQFRENQANPKLAKGESSANEPDKENITTDDSVASGVDITEGVIKFQTPYVFEGKTISELDLRGLKGLSYSAVQKHVMPIYETLPQDGFDAVPEITNEFIIAAAAYTTKLPVEFFTSDNGLKFCHFFAMRTVVRNFLLQEA